MPLYDYRCEQCGHKLEALQKLSDDPLIDCPACGAASLRKQLSAPNFRLKGGGWYETDFKSGDKKNLHGDGEKQDKPADTAKEKTGEKPGEKTGEKTDGKSGEKSGGNTEPAPKPAEKPAEGAKKTASPTPGTD